MKVFVAMYGYLYDGDYVVGVFSSKEKGYEFLEEKYKDFGDYQKVYEWELDVGE